MARAVKAVDDADAVAAAAVAVIAKGQPQFGGEAPEGEFLGAREASDEERAFHHQQANGSRTDEPGEHAPQESPREAAHQPAERPERVEHAEPPREQRSEGTQAPLDLPPPPPAKPFVVWSSSPTGTPETRRDE